MYLVDFTRFRVRGEAQEPLLRAHRAWMAECAASDRFRGGLLVALDDGEWLDVAIWRSQAVDRRSPRDARCELVDQIDWADPEILGQETGPPRRRSDLPNFAPRRAFMSTSQYILFIGLFVFVVGTQVGRRQPNAQRLIIPVVIVGAFGFKYVKSIPSGTTPDLLIAGGARWASCSGCYRWR